MGGSKSGKAFDPIRYARWAFFGLVLQGPWNHAFYLALDAALPPTPDPFTITTLEKVGIDQFVEAKGLAFAQNQIQTELKGILIKNWAIFIPATAINIAYCPPELRVLFLNCVFFGWVIYLSLLLNEGDADGEAV